MENCFTETAYKTILSFSLYTTKLRIDENIIVSLSLFWEEVEVQKLPSCSKFWEGTVTVVCVYSDVDLYHL